MISERISVDIPPQIKIFNIVIPILMHYLLFSFIKTVKIYYVATTLSCSRLHKTGRQLHIFTGQPMKSDVTYWRRIGNSISQDILPQIYDVIQSDVAFHSQVQSN